LLSDEFKVFMSTFSIGRAGLPSVRLTQRAEEMAHAARL
jgi:hypothetical protein